MSEERDKRLERLCQLPPEQVPCQDDIRSLLADYRAEKITRKAVAAVNEAAEARVKELEETGSAWHTNTERVIASLKAENEALRAERDEALADRTIAEKHARDAESRMRDALVEANHLRAERERLRESADDQFARQQQVIGDVCAQRDRLREGVRAMVAGLGSVVCPECDHVFMVTVPEWLRALASGEEKP